MNVYLPAQDNINTNYLQRLFDNMSECYKLFWFQSIIEQVFAGFRTIKFETLVNSMIANSWYMVTEYKLNLGPADTLEALVIDAFKKSGLKSSENKDKIIQTINDLNDAELNQKKMTLTYNVPYRLQAPFLTEVKGKGWNVPKKELANKINSHPGILYKFVSIDGLNSMIEVDEAWCLYILANYEILQGWIESNLIHYLQRRNPHVPGIPNKIYPPQERKLEKVKSLWKKIMSITPMRDIYTNEMIDVSKMSIDHFIPWSYVAHDELWNLSPTSKSVNSKKSNNLPIWNEYFPALQQQEFQVYTTIWKYPEIHTEFDKCARDHINSVEIKNKLYRANLSQGEFFNELESVLSPVYHAAETLGFKHWRLE